MKIWKKAAAAITALPMMLAGVLVMPTIANAEQERDLDNSHLIASYDFEDENNKGKDTSGNGNDLTLHGNLEYGKPGDFGSKVIQLRGDTGEYLELPQGLFDGKDSVTIQFDSKSRMADSDNFFSFSIGENNQKYFYSRLRPSNVYTAITKSSNGGEQSVSAASNTSSAWHTYRLTISPKMIAVFVDGALKGVNAKVTTKLSDLGTNLKSTFGRSTWDGDKYYNGGIDNVRIWDAAYVSDDMVWDGITLPGSTEDDIALPGQDALGNAITWSSGNSAIMSNDGTIVSRPASDTTVTMTATSTIDGAIHTRNYDIAVLAAITSPDKAAERLLLPYQLTSGTVLPTTIPGVAGAGVTWQSSNTDLVKQDGTVVGAGGDTAKSVDLTATVTLNGTVTKKFSTVQVMPKNAQTIASYTRNSSVDGGTRVGGALHLALSADGTSYTALNQNYGVAFAEAKYTTNESAKTTKWEIRDLTDPYLFRMADGTYAYVAIATTDNGTRVDPGSILFSTSSDLVQWSGQPNDDVIDGQRTITSDATAFDAGSLTAGWDASANCYRIGWSVNGVSKYVTTTDFTTFSGAKNGPSFTKTTVNDLAISASIAGNTMAIDADTAKAVSEKLGRVTNTGVSNPADMSVQTGADKNDLLAQIQGGETLKNGNLSKGATAKASYSDGGTHDFRVNWNADDLDAIDTSTPGEYTVNGTIDQQNFSDGTMMKWRADPNVVFWQNKYYFIATNEGSDKNIYIRSSDTMEGLKDASEPVSDKAGGHYVPGQDTFLWGDKDDTGHEGYHWAPELHVIKDSKGVEHLYCFYAQKPTADNDGTNIPYTGPNWAGPAAYVMELADGGDPMKVSDWTENRVIKQDGSHLSDSALTIDMTYFEVNGKSYLAWSQGDETYKGALANVSIAETSKDKPWQIIGTPTRISRCEYGWELGGVNEGPNVLVNGSKVYMVFSAQYVGTQYATGMLVANVGDDLTKAASWTKSNYPWMHNGVFAGQSGLGHNSYFTDPYGDTYNVYHFGGNGSRHASIVPVHFRTDGSPILDMKVSEELDQSKKNVTLTVTVSDKPVTPGGGDAGDGDGGDAGTDGGAGDASQPNQPNQSAQPNGQGALPITGIAIGSVALLAVLAACAAAVLIARRARRESRE
jgi:GH43 family beta-xylosidase